MTRFTKIQDIFGIFDEMLIGKTLENKNPFSELGTQRKG